MNILKNTFSSLKYQLIISSLLGILTGCLNSAIIALINQPETNYYSFETQHVFIFILFVTFTMTLFSKSLLIQVSENVIYHLCQSVCKKILHADLSQIEKIGKSKIYAVLNQDLGMLSNGLLIMPQLLINLTIIIACCLYLDLLSSFFMSITFFVLILFFIFFYNYDRLLVRSKFESLRNSADKLHKSYQSMLEGFKELKLNQTKRKQFTEEHLLNAALEMKNKATKALTLYSNAQIFWDNLFYLFIGGLIFWGGARVDSNIDNTKIIIALLFMIGPLKSIMMALPQIRQAIVSIQKIASLEIKSEGLTEVTQPITINNIILQSVSYHYEGFELKPINTIFDAGQITFIIGQNGSGKSTLAKIISGLYLPTTGKLLINNQVLTKELMENYRNQVFAIFTDFYLFDELPLNINSESVDKLLQKLNLKGKLLIENEKINSRALSDGQRKRVALLYGYLEDRQIYIFDEWACDQDPEYKKIFYEELLPELKVESKIVIVISHDDRYFHIADNILRLS